MEQIRKEIDYIMLSCIARCGFDAMPQDYHFLNRYSLLNIYIEIVNATTDTRQAKHFEDAAKAQAATLLNSDYAVNALQAYLVTNGRKATKALFGNNTLYWAAFLKLSKRNTNAHP